MKHLILLASLVVLLGACVPNRKIVYLQKDDLHKKDAVTDSVVRSYSIQIEEYKIQPLDILSIKVETLTEGDFDFISKLYPTSTQSGGAGANNIANQLINGFLVDNNGEIEFPVVGKIKFSELSVFEAQEKMQEILRPYLKDPVARIRLLNFRFTLLGEVNRENQIISTNTRVTLMEAIGLAGGVTDLADRSMVKIIRQRGDRSEIFYMNLLDENLLNTENYYVQQNDIIVVPALRQRPFRKYWAENISIIISTTTLLLLTLNFFNQI